MAFARRFEPGALFPRAGVDQLIHRQHKLNPRNRPLTSTWVPAIYIGVAHLYREVVLPHLYLALGTRPVPFSDVSFSLLF